LSTIIIYSCITTMNKPTVNTEGWKVWKDAMDIYNKKLETEDGNTRGEVGRLTKKEKIDTWNLIKTRFPRRVTHRSRTDVISYLK